MNYHGYELAHACISPMRFGAQSFREFFDTPFNPLSYTVMGKSMVAACELFERATRRYGKPRFDIDRTTINGVAVPVREEAVLERTFCRLLRFERDLTHVPSRDDPKVLIVAPLSGHYATLLRGTVTAMLPEHDVYITDWADARAVPANAGGFDLDDFIDYAMRFLRFLGPDVHVIAVCQPAVPVLAAAALLAAADDPRQPASITLMGGPIDTRRNPTAVNRHAEAHDLDWFEKAVITRVPYPHPGFGRRVYPGYVQLGGFTAMNLERHVTAHADFFAHLVQGDCDSAEQHRRFYDEFLAVMDLPAEFYLQTLDRVFHRHALPNGTFRHRGRPVDCAAIRKPTLMTVEGELDDICGLGQTSAAHDLCVNLPAAQKIHYVQDGVGHYGVFNGTRWRTEIQPRIREMIGTARHRTA